MSATEPRAVLIEELGRIAPDVDVASIDESADLREEFDIDSMDFLNLVTALAKRFAIPVPEADYPRLASFTEAVAYLGEKMAAG